MKDTVFIINNRFTVNSLRNEVFDREKGQKSRLEPRLMKLLCILAEHQGNVVKREFIIKEIWNDYPGANEGLNQAISFLRRLLADGNKEIIQTQPKTGYVFNSVISRESGNIAAGKRNYMPAIVVAAVLFLLLFFMVIRYYEEKDIPINQDKQLYERDAAEIGRRDSIHQAKQMQRLQDTSGNAEMKRMGKADAVIARSDSIHPAERHRKLDSQ